MHHVWRNLNLCQNSTYFLLTKEATYDHTSPRLESGSEYSKMNVPVSGLAGLPHLYDHPVHDPTLLAARKDGLDYKTEAGLLLPNLLPLSTRPCKWTPKSTFTISQTQSGQQSQPLQRGQQPYQQMPKCSFRMVQPPHQTQCLVVSHQLTQGFHKKLWNNILNGWVKHLDPMMGLVSMIHYCGIQGPTAAAALSPVIVSPWLKVSVRVIEFTQRSWPTVFTYRTHRTLLELKHCWWTWASLTSYR